MYQDTIAAISTPPGQGGIGIVRLSGSEARNIAGKIFSGKLVNRKLVYGKIREPGTGNTVDEVLVSYMAAPHTYTREDIAEINCHGGLLPLQKILELCLEMGARLAGPGEFTLRAFINGRIDLAQAEAVLDVIKARTEAGLRLAVRGLNGELSAAVKHIRSELVSALAYLSACIDFPEDEVEERNITGQLEKAQSEVERLIETAGQGIVYRQGVRTAIVGKPNVGKSSLLNRLLGQERAIVTPVPGTTRDTIEEVLDIKSIPFVLVDTAGITRSKDPVESMGIERSRRAINEADFVLFVVDAGAPVNGADLELARYLEQKNVLLVANKCDLPRKIDLRAFARERVFVSALTGEGIEELRKLMSELVLGGKVIPSDSLLVANPRHRSALNRANSSLKKALSDLKQGVPHDFITIHLGAAADALGDITGETIRDDLLENIFSQFCIGK